MAKSHLEKIALDTMIGQAADRRGYLYTEIKAELKVEWGNDYEKLLNNEEPTKGSFWQQSNSHD